MLLSSITRLTVANNLVVKPPTRSHWRDEEGRRQREIWRTSRLLLADGLDPECDLGMLHISY